MSNEFNLYPNLKKTITLVKCKYNVFNYIPYTSCQISAQFFTTDDIPFETKIYELNQSNGFNNWSNDDKYLEMWLKDQINLN